MTKKVSIKNHPGRMIQAILKLKGLNQADIARRLGIGKGTISSVIRGARRSARVENQIAAMLGIKTSNLWLPTKRTHTKFILGRRVTINESKNG